MYNRLKLFLASAGLLFLCSCSSSGNEKLDERTFGDLELTVNWNNASSHAVIPSLYSVTINADWSLQNAVLSGSKNKFPDPIPSGKARVWVYNLPNDVLIEGETATVRKLSSASNTIEALPGWLFSAAQEVNIIANEMRSTTIAMKQLIRELTLTINLEGEYIHEIKAIEGVLSGISNNVHLISGQLQHTEPFNVVPAFKNKDMHTLEANVRVLGIDTREKQVLSLQIVFQDESTQLVESDLSSLLAGFNSILEKELEADMLITGGGTTKPDPESPEFLATIQDWRNVSGTGTAQQ